ncbi:DUF4242 domain-containing protein [Paraburkholderia hospita]|uniref:DUF4242 domain-containing protein n=1 Tax=Paraburkholderia hospita TaxID=169430 RepID=UPI003ED0391D
MDRFESALERYRQIATSGQHFVDKWCVTGAQAMRAILVGDFSEAENKTRDSLHMAQNADANLATGVYGMQMFAIRREQGRLAEVAPIFKRFVDEHSEDATWRPGFMLICSDLGFEAQARDNLVRLAESESSIPVDSKRLVTLTYLAEVAARLRDVEHAGRIYALLLPFQDQVVTVPVFTLCCGSAARFLGMLAHALGDWSAAERHFEYALRMDERLRAWPWLAHGRHEYALMLAARNGIGDRARAQDLLSMAAATAKNSRCSRSSSASLARRQEQGSKASRGLQSWTCNVQSLFKENHMPRFMIERNFAEQLEVTGESAATVKRINDEEGVEWLFSFLSADKKKTYCLYEAPNADAIRAAARRADLPADVIIEVSDLRPEMFN